MLAHFVRDENLDDADSRQPFEDGDPADGIGTEKVSKESHDSSEVESLHSEISTRMCMTEALGESWEPTGPSDVEIMGETISPPQVFDVSGIIICEEFDVSVRFGR